MRTRTHLSAALLAVLGIPAATGVAGAAGNDAATAVPAPPSTAVAPTASPTTPTAPSTATVGTVAPSVATVASTAPTVATGSTLVPATATPTPTGFTVASSLDELVTSFNDAGKQLNADPAQQYPVVVLSPQMFTTVPSGAVNVFAGAIANGAIMGGRLDATSGAVREFAVLFNQAIPEADTITVISAAIAVTNQDAAHLFLDYYDMVTSGEFDRAHVWGGGISIAVQEFGDAGENVAIAFMAQAADDETAYANMEALTSAVLWTCSTKPATADATKTVPDATASLN